MKGWILMSNNNQVKVAINYYSKLIGRILRSEDCFSKGFSNVKINEEVSNFNCALVHAAIRPIKIAVTGSPFDYIVDSLNSCDEIYIPAFTPSFRNSGVYVSHLSRPEVGAFSNTAFSKKLYRTSDPVHSLFCSKKVKDIFVMNDTFHPDGVFKKFVEQGSCWINFGTPYLVSTVFHYIERYCNVPYLEKDLLKGSVFYQGSFHEIHHTSYKYNRKIVWNRKKIERDLIFYGCLKKTNVDGFVFRIVDGHSAFNFFKSELMKDPYYMVSP